VVGRVLRRPRSRLPVTLFPFPVSIGARAAAAEHDIEQFDGGDEACAEK